MGRPAINPAPGKPGRDLASAQLPFAVTQGVMSRGRIDLLMNPIHLVEAAVDLIVGERWWHAPRLDERKCCGHTAKRAVRCNAGERIPVRQPQVAGSAEITPFGRWASLEEATRGPSCDSGRTWAVVEAIP